MKDKNQLNSPLDNSKTIKSNQPPKAKPRINLPIRNQSEMRIYCIDDLILPNHKARMVWKYVQSLDLSEFIGEIKAVEGNPGRSATSPHLLLALWLYATIEGIMNGRVIEKYCSEHNAFIWLCGDVKVNYHTINDFRINNKDRLNNLLTQSITVFLDAGLINVEDISQDGIRVRANAGTSSFRRKETIQDYLDASEEYIKSLEEYNLENPGETSNCQKAAELSKAKEQNERIKKSAEEVDKIIKTKEQNQKNGGRKFSEEKKLNTRVSITDPEARKMKMANSGYSPAYNVQLAADVKSKVVVGVDVTNSCVDTGLMISMHEQVIARTNIHPKSHLADGGYRDHKDIEKIKKINQGCKIIVPVKNSHLEESYIPKENESEANKEWRIYMGTIEAKEKYKDRASTSEFVNAQARNRGLQQFVVRGVEKVLSTMLIFAVTHNMVKAWSLLG